MPAAESAMEIVSVFTSLAIAVFLFIASRKIEKQNFSNSLKSSWIALDSTVLNNDKLLIELDNMLHAGVENDSIRKRRRRWLAYMIGNTLSVNFNGLKDKLLPDSAGAEKSLEKALQGLSRHPEFMQVVDYFYEQEFRTLCYRMQKENQERSSAIRKWSAKKPAR